ncbi:Hypothetical_protein [Hexamita inflata]|uniref:Hypothetical_protein n=1 Tax=Hexamita inflata TaxID=28002 RepID=A0AA86UQH4_9EUKA|nr:Hypothetical protein HINF_LOCUS48392 [Hexamita inflata]
MQRSINRKIVLELAKVISKQTNIPVIQYVINHQLLYQHITQASIFEWDAVSQKVNMDVKELKNWVYETFRKSKDLKLTLEDEKIIETEVYAILQSNQLISDKIETQIINILQSKLNYQYQQNVIQRTIIKYKQQYIKTQQTQTQSQQQGQPIAEINTSEVSDQQKLQNIISYDDQTWIDDQNQTEDQKNDDTFNEYARNQQAMKLFEKHLNKF